MADVARILGSADAFAVLELPKAPVAVAEVRSHYRRVMDDCDDCCCGQERPWKIHMEPKNGGLVQITSLNVFFHMNFAGFWFR